MKTKGIRRGLLLCILLLISVLCAGIFAACGSKNVKLTFHTNGGEAMQTVTVAKGTEHILEEPTWEGHSFLGWYLDEDLTNGPVTKFKADKNQDFYAKWEEEYLLTLRLNGGTIAGVSGSEVSIWLKANTNLASVLKDYVPQKEGGQFAAWYDGDTEVSATATMGKAALTLTARYKVQYSVTLMLQSLEDPTVYEQAAEPFIGYEAAGTSFLPAPKVPGFKQITHEGESSAKVLSEDPAQNTFTLYFDRVEARVIFNANAPDDSSFDDIEITAFFGSKVELPSDLFEVNGYILTGWSTKLDGSDVISNNYIESRLYNGPKDLETPTITVEKETTILFGVWTKGYVDMFGGYDYIYHFNAEATEIYLSRGGQFFLGTYTARNSIFRFVNAENRMVLQGKLLDNGKYVYFDESVDGFSRKLFVFGEGIQEDTTIYFDAYNGITYSVASTSIFGSTTDDSVGSYIIDDEGFYVATFTSGSKAGETITFMTGTAGSTNVFAIRSNEEYSWGAMHRLAVNGSNLTYYLNGYYMLQLDGFGTAGITTNGQTSTYSYIREGDEITLLNSNNSVYGVARHILMEDRDGEEMHCYAFYFADYDHTYTGADDSTLILDGMYNANYNGTPAYYTIYSSAFGRLAQIATPDDTYLFLLKTTSKTEYDEEGNTTTVYDYTFELRNPKYVEYYYCDTSYTNEMLVILNEEVDGTVTIYGRNADKVYEKILVGTYTVDQNTGFYSVKVTEHFEFSESVTRIYDYANLEAFTFGTDVYILTSMFGTATYPVTYWYSVTMKGEEEAKNDFVLELNEVDGDGKLTLVGAFAVLEWTLNGEPVVINGQFEYDSKTNRLMITPYGSAFTLPIEVDLDELTFIVLDDLLGGAYRLNPVDGSRISTETILFDGKGGAIYSYQVEEDGKKVTKEIEGRVTAANEITLGEWDIYVFTALEGDYTFRFILLASSTYSYFAVEKEELKGSFTSEDGMKLELDGFGFYAQLMLADGTLLEGQYIMPDETTVYFVLGGQYGFYFDLEGETFKVRGSEYGEDYLLIDNNGSRGIYFAFDGYGHLKVYRLEVNEERTGYEQIMLDENAVYEIRDGKLYLDYTIGADHYQIYGLTGTLTQNGRRYPVFIQEHEEVVSIYVNPADWTVLELDAYGNLLKHKTDGSVELGMYLLVTDDLLYYVNSNGSDACLYRYDRANGIVTEIRYKARGYFTTELDALLFSDAGFMVEAGTTRYYYELDKDGNVILWHQDWEDETHNEYGFVKSTDFGKFEDTKVLGGKTYYVNTGYAIVFQREEDNANKYPLKMTKYVLDENGDRVVENNRYKTEVVKVNLEQLSFTPAGTAEFAVRGSVIIDGTNYTCTVYRRYNEETEAYRMYITIDAGASVYVFDINVTYTGDSISETSHNVYTILSMETEINLYSSTWLYNYYMYAMMYGIQFPNYFGQILIVDEYDEEGEITEEYVLAAFGPYSNMIDTKGKLFSFDHVAYNYDGSTGLYTVEIEHTDGYTYRLYFKISNQYTSVFGVYSYDVVAFTRTEEIEMEDGYKLVIERVVASDMYQPGSYLEISIYKDEVKIENDTMLLIYQNTLYYIIRMTDENNKYTTAEYYVITLTFAEDPATGGAEAEGSEVKDKEEGEGEEDEELTLPNPLPLIASATMQKHVNARTYYSADGKDYVDITEGENPEVDFISIGNGRAIYLIESCEYDEATGTYTVITLASNKVFNVTVTEDGVATIVEVVETKD